MSSNNKRKTLDGPSRSETGVVPKKINQYASSSNIKGQSKSNSTLNKVCRERSPARAVSSNSVRLRNKSSHRNLSRPSSRGNEKRVVSQTSSKTREWDKSFSQPPPRGKKSDRSLIRLPPKSPESNRIVSRSPRNKKSDPNLSRLPVKSRESDRSVSRVSPKGRESNRNLARLLKSKKSDYSVARSPSKIRGSNPNLPRLPLQNRDSDRTIARPVTREKSSERKLARTTTKCREVSKPTTKCDKTRDSSRLSPKDSKRSIFSPKSPASSASGLARGQPSGTGNPAKQKSGKSPSTLRSHKIFSQFSLKKLSSFAFKKKKTGVPNKCAAVLKGKEKPRSTGSAPGSTQLDEATQSSGPWTGSVGTSTKHSRDSLGTKPIRPPSSQQSQSDQQALSRSAEHPGRGGEATLSKPSKERLSDQKVLCISRKSAGRRLEPAYQQDDLFSVESFVDHPEKSTPRQEYECYCHPEDSTTKPAWSKKESVCSGESLTRPKEDYVSSPESLAGEPKENSVVGSKKPKEDVYPSKDGPTSSPARHSVCSPEVSIGEMSTVQKNLAYVCSSKTSTIELSSSPLQIDNLCLDDPAQAVPSEGHRDSVVQHTASQECLDSIPEGEAPKTRFQRDVNSLEADKPTASDPGFKKSQYQLNATRLPAASVQLPPKREASILKRTTFESVCLPTSPPERAEATKEDTCVDLQKCQENTPKYLIERSKTPSKTVKIATKTGSERDVAGTRITSECLADEPSMDGGTHPYKPASEPSVQQPLEKDYRQPKGIQSLPDLEAARDALEKKSQGVNTRSPKTSLNYLTDEAPDVCTPQANALQGDRSFGEQGVSCENLARLSQVDSTLRQDTIGTSDTSTEAAQYQLYAVRESIEPLSDATEAPLNACASDVSQESLPVVEGHGRTVWKPPPTGLTCYQEEFSRSAEGDPQSHTESISFSKSEAQLEKSSTVREKESLPAEDLAPSKDCVWARLETMPLVQCKCGNGSSDSTEPPPDESNLSTDGSLEKEQSVDDEAPQPKPTASEEKSARSSFETRGSPSRSLSPTTKSSKVFDEKGRLKSMSSKKCPNGEQSSSKPVSSRTKSSDGNEQTKSSRPEPLKGETLLPEEHSGETAECKSPSAQKPQAGEELPQKSRKSPPLKESSGAHCENVSKPKCPPGKSPFPDKLSENIGVDRPVCLSQRRSTAESNDSIIQKLGEEAEAIPAEEGTAARCEPITKLKLKKQYKEPTQSDLRDIQEDIRIWKDLYAGCLERLRSLQKTNQVPVRSNASDRATDLGIATDKLLRRTSNNGQCSMNEIKGGMDEAVRVLESEYGQVESALRKHSAVLAELVSVLQNRMTAQPDVATAGEMDPGAVRDVKDSIHYLKALISENETLTMQLAAERAKQQVLRQVQVTNDVVDESISATEDKLHRTNSLLKMQMKRLQYEMSRLTEAQNIEIKAGSIFVEQAEADVVNDLEALHKLQESNDRLHELLSSKRFVSGQRVFKRASRGSFLSEEMISGTYCSLRRDQLELRLVVSDRVQRNVELSNDEIQNLHALGRRMCDEISETNEEIRKSEFAWLQLRKERDELTKDLYPDVERLEKMQDVAKEKLDLESKLRKENMLFRRQLEEFQKDLLEVETELMSGAITRRTEATKNKVLELETLYENAKSHNSNLREECDSKNLTISRHDSLASLSIDEEEFQRQISEKIQRMELRIQADMDRRLLRPKRYVLEAPGKSKVSFRGQRNVIRAPKNLADGRRKRDVPQGVTEPPKPQQPKDVQELRREILAKLAEEKERAKEQLLRYEAHQARHAADTTAEPNAQELNELLGRLGRFLNQTRAQEPSPARSATAAAAPSLHGGEFGETLMHLIVQLDQLQSALTGESSRRRTVRPPTLASERHRELLETLPDASKRGSRASNPNHQNNGNNNGNNNNS